MAGKAVPLDVMGKTVSKNVRTQRERIRLTQEEVAARTSKYDRPMAVPTLRSIENGRRRIDVDDLVVLALALETSPYALLAPAEPSDVSAHLPDYVDVDDVKAWLRGETELEPAALLAYWSDRHMELGAKDWEARRRLEDAPDSMSQLINEQIESITGQRERIAARMADFTRLLGLGSFGRDQ